MTYLSKMALSAVAVITAITLMGLSTDNRQQPGVGEGSNFFVSGSEFNAVVQERAGYAFGLGHYVGQHHALKSELKGWQDMVRELSGMAESDTLVGRLHGTRQERLGYEVATDQLLTTKAGLNQSIMGYQIVLDHQIAQNKALIQEQMGLRYMLGMQAKRAS